MARTSDNVLPRNGIRGGRRALSVISGWRILAAALACMAMQPAVAQDQPATRTTFLELMDDANALLLEPAEANPNERIVAIVAHPTNENTFDYFTGRRLVERGYRVIEINHYGDETTFEILLPPIAAAIKYARGIAGVEKVVLVGHSGGGPELSDYQEIAEKGPSACQEPNRLYPCDAEGLTDLPKADALLLLDPNEGAPHRMLSVDPAVGSREPKARNPWLDMYNPENGFDPETNTASYGAAFLTRYQTAMQSRLELLVADAKSRLQAIDAHTGPFNDDEPFVIPGMAENAVGARLNLPDGNILSETHSPRLQLKADGTTPVEIVKSTRKPAATKPDQRDTMQETTQNTTVRHYLSFLAIRTTPDFALTRNNMTGIDWRSSANSVIGNVENVGVPTLIMAGTCSIHIVPLELAFEHSAAKDKEFVAVEGANHSFKPCGPEYGDTQKRTFDYVEAWLNKRF